MTYSEQLKDPRWQKKRLEVLQRDNFKCCECSEDTITLHVHHRYYVAKRMAWEYPNVTYVTLCKNCHKVDGENPYWETILSEIMAAGEDVAGSLSCSLASFRMGGILPTQTLSALAFWITTKNGEDFVRTFDNDAKTARYYSELRKQNGGPSLELR